MKKRMISLVCSLALAFSLAVPAFAKEVKQTEVPVTLTVINAAQKISVTVPAALPVSVVEGNVVTATNSGYHITHVKCTTCSAAYGVSNDPHTFSGDTCTLCGYTRSGSGGGDTSCSHGRYSYNCEYYNSNYHYVSKVCRDCGEEVDYFQENHSLRNSFSQYDGSYHTYEAYCTECNETIDSSREAHNWTYDYRSYSSTEHRVDMTCRDCDYSTTDYENHRDSNGDGRCDDCSESLSVTVTWNAGANGGTVNGSSSVTTAVTSGGVASAPGYTPVKAGYTFKGWYTSASGGSLYNTVSVTSARTFYAQFTQVPIP